MHRLCLILLFLLPMISAGQNLVPNGDLALDNDTCDPQSYPDPEVISPWFSVWNANDFYHACYPEHYSVPLSAGGGEPAFSGDGYFGVYAYSKLLGPYREFMSIELTEPLVQNISYHAAIHISRMDSCWYAVKNFGLHFSQGMPESDLSYFFEQEPQVKNEGDSFLTSIHGWNTIEGSFIAVGGEKYLTIGNFNNDLYTDTLFIPGGGIPPSHSALYWGLAYYYVDGVSVIPDSILQNVDESNFTFSIYPNPATTNLTIESRTPLAQVWVRDVAGRPSIHHPLVADGTQGDRAVVDVSGLPSGIYLVEVLTQNGQRSVQKVVVE